MAGRPARGLPRRAAPRDPGAGTAWYVDRTLEEIDQVLTLNLLAPMHLCRLVLPGMLERGRGQIVNLSSMAAVFAPPGLATYGASKAGLSHFTGACVRTCATTRSPSRP